MKRIVLIAGFLINAFLAGAQAYNPSLHIVFNKPIGIAQDVPTDARSYFYDTVKKVYRPYQSTGEVLAYLNLAKWREGSFSIFINQGGTIGSNGKFTGGTKKEYWFKDGTTNSDLVVKSEDNSGTVAQLRAMYTTTGKVYISTNFGGGTFIDEGLDDGSTVDDGATILHTANGHRLRRQITGDVYPEWWGAIPNDGLNDYTPFTKAITFIQTLKGAKTLRISGRYNINSKLIVPGYAWADDNSVSSWTGIPIKGNGSLSSILDFSASTTGGLQYGTDNTNTLNAGIEDISIVGNQNITGLTLKSTAPYTCTINRFSNLYITDVKDGIVDSASTTFYSVDHANVFLSPKIERYWRYGVHTLGVYSAFIGVPFIVHPMGSGSATLAALIEGQGNTFDNFTCEDQIRITGYDNSFHNLKIEKVIKTVGYSGFFGQVIQIDGINCSIIGGKVNDVDNSLINTIFYIVGRNIKISDFQYRNEESDPAHVIQNPIIFENVSSGVLDNVSLEVVNAFDKEGYYEKSQLNWEFINVKGEQGQYSKGVNEIKVETPPSGTWPAGVKAINKTPLPGEPPYWIRAIAGTDSSWVSSINTLDQIAGTGNATSRVLISNAGMYAPDHHLNGNSANNISGYFTTLGTSAVVQGTNYAGTGGASLVLNKSGGKVGIGKDPGSDSLDVEGTGRFSGRVSASPALANSELVTLGQLRDSNYLHGAVAVDSAQLAHWGDATGHTVTGSITETTVYSRTIPANTLGPNGHLKIEYYVGMTNNANNKRIRVYVGGTLMADATLSSASGYQCVSRLANRGSQAASVSPDPASNYAASGGSTAVKTYELNWSVPNNLVVTITNANSGDTTILEDFQAFFYY